MKTFELSDEQEQFIDKWYSSHMCSGAHDRNALAYEFSFSGIGTRVIVRCTICNAAVDVTEYEKW